MMKTLLHIMAVIETATGVALVLSPSMVVWLLLDSSVDTPTGLVLARVAGAALLALGVACALNQAGRAATALVVPMLAYNVAVSALLVHARAVLELTGIGLWPAVVLHAALAVWCAACLARYRLQGSPAAAIAPSPSGAKDLH